MILIGNEKIDREYEILKELGSGGMSTVYLATKRGLKTQWVIKKVKRKGNSKKDEQHYNNIIAEANLMKELNHPCFPRIADINTDDPETTCIIMDYVEGQSLDKLLSANNEEMGELITEERVIDWAKQICEGLHYLHSHNPPIIYCDMKPSNLMLNPERGIKPEGYIHIIDFGIARVCKDGKYDGGPQGTPGYAPPEQKKGHVDPRTDIYALGMTMHHLLTREIPKEDTEYFPVRHWNPKLSEGIELIIDKCVQKKPENRYPSCKELLKDLNEPERLTRTFIAEQKKRVMIFASMLVTSMFLLIAGMVCGQISNNKKNNDYENLVNVTSSTSYEEKIESYKKAIQIYPNDTRAYDYMLDAYVEDKEFSNAENDEFQALYNANQNGFAIESSTYAELNYKIGLTYFNYYMDKEKNDSFSNRVQRAITFFEKNYNNKELIENFENQKISDCYYQICSFYKKYILNTVEIQEASKDNYEELFVTIETVIEDIKETGAGAYDQLALYNATFMLLYDQRTYMASVNVDKDKILELLDDIKEYTGLLTPRKTEAQELKNEIETKYESYREAIERVYSNTEERSS